MMSVLSVRLASKENARIHVHLNSVVSKLSVQLMCTEQDVSVLKDIKVALM